MLIQSLVSLLNNVFKKLDKRQIREAFSNVEMVIKTLSQKIDTNANISRNELMSFAKVVNGVFGKIGLDMSRVENRISEVESRVAGKSKISRISKTKKIKKNASK